MSTIHSMMAAWQFNRTRTLASLDRVEKEADPQKVLAWRPGPARAHVAWQLAHIAVTEDLFATERLAPEKQPTLASVWSRFRGGSTPDDDIPSAAQLRAMLADSRANLLDTMSRFSDKDLGWMPEALKERKLLLIDVLHILNWHETHHQGQIHITLNLWKAAGG